MARAKKRQGRCRCCGCGRTGAPGRDRDRVAGFQPSAVVLNEGGSVRPLRKRQSEQVQYVTSRKVETRIQSRSFEFSGVAFRGQMIAGGTRPAGISVQVLPFAFEPLEPHTMNATISAPIAAMIPITALYSRTLVILLTQGAGETQLQRVRPYCAQCRGPLDAGRFQTAGSHASSREGRADDGRARPALRSSTNPSCASRSTLFAVELSLERFSFVLTKRRNPATSLRLRSTNCASSLAPSTRRCSAIAARCPHRRVRQRVLGRSRNRVRRRPRLDLPRAWAGSSSTRAGGHEARARRGGVVAAPSSPMHRPPDS